MQSPIGRHKIIYIAPTPPPFMGPSIATSVIMRSSFVEVFDVVHIDTADRRPIDTLARIDFTNIYLALKHYVILLFRLLFSGARGVYIPISQTRIGFLRDLPFIWMSWLFGKRIILHLRGGYFREFYNSSSGLMKFLIRISLARVDGMIVLGQSLRKLFDGLIKPENIFVVPNGLDIDFSGLAAADKKSDRVVVLFLSNLFEDKGFPLVLMSARELLSKGLSNIRFVFAGEWANHADKIKYTEYVKANGLEGNVEFLGTVSGDRKKKTLLEADIFVMPTSYRYEGHPWVIVEAMAAGLPIIATDHAAITESVEDGVNGFIVPKGDDAALARRIEELANDPALRASMGENSRRLYHQKFTEDRFVGNMIDVFRTVMERN